MDLYKELARLRCFSYADMVQLCGSEKAADWQIKTYLKKGYIERVRRNLYVVISMETEQPIANRFQIASQVTEDACISHHSAFEYYGYANQVFYEVYFSTHRNIRSFSYDGLQYTPLPNPSTIEILDMNNGVKVTSLERTVIDSIIDMDKIAGLEEFLRCLELIPSLNEEKLLDVLEGYSKKQLYQKVGYILEFYKKDLSLSKDFFLKCISCSSSSKTYLTQEIRDNIFHPKWLLYAPKDLKQLINKGVEYDDVI